MSRRTTALITAALLIAAGQADAQSTWTGFASSSWNSPFNWIGGVPGNNSQVIFSGNPTNFPNQPTGTTILNTMTFSAGTASFSGLNTSGEIFALRDNASFTALTQASANIQTINQLDLYFTNTSNTRTATVNLSGTGGLTLNEGLRWGLGAGHTLVVQGPGSLTVNGTIRGDLRTNGSTGAATARGITLAGDATSGQTVTFNPTNAGAWLVGTVTLGGRVTLNIANAGAIDSGSFNFASGGNNASLLITGTTSGSTMTQNVAFNGGSVTGGTQTIGVDIAGTGSATYSGSITTAGTGNTVSLLAGTNDTAIFSGAITGSRPMSISGTGNVVITGNANTYSGGTTINSGATLYANNASGSATGTGNVAVNGTLAGSGTAGNGATAVTVASGGTISPGATAGSVGALTVNGSLTMSSGSTYAWTITNAGNGFGSSVTAGQSGGVKDLLVANSFSLTNPTIDIGGAGVTLDPSLYYSWQIAQSNSAIGVPGSYSINTPGGSWANRQITLSSGSIGGGLFGLFLNVEAVPEPSEIALGVLATAGIAIFLYRRSRAARVRPQALAA